jgi:hypothetical protein
MEYSSAELRNIRNRFLDVWPIDRIKNLTIDEYCIGDKENFGGNFCYWVEIVTSKLGSIRGPSSSFKFGIFKNPTKKEYKSSLYKQLDRKYAWMAEYGDTPEKAFAVIKRNLIAVVENSIKGNFSKIDEINLYSVFKWKVAYLYSDEKLFPAFSSDFIKYTANYLNYIHNLEKLSEFYTFAIKKMPATETVYEYSHRLWALYKDETYTPEIPVDYYVVGTFYTEARMINKMIEKGVVGIGFPPDKDLEYIYRSSKEDVILETEKNIDGSINPQRAKNAVRSFLQIKIGDRIALKSFRSMTKNNYYAKIGAYGIVVERDGSVYRYDDELGHCLNIDYIETKLDKKVKLNLPRTVQKIEDRNKINMIFGTEFGDEKKVRKARRRVRRRSKNSEVGFYKGRQERRPSNGCVAYLLHNEIQEKFYKYLVEKHGENRIEAEENYVDLKLKLDDKHIFFEVKSNDYADECAEDGIGQLLKYMAKDQNNLRKELFIIGPYGEEEEDMEFINFLKENLKVKFEYSGFDVVQGKPVKDIL